MVAPEALHVTLAFLGWRDESDVDVVATAVRAAARPVVALSVGAALWLPRRRPRVLAVELEDGDGTLAAVQGDVVRGLVDAVGFEPERRAFLPHVTVARVRSGDHGLPELSPPPALGAFAARAVTLFRSHLSPQGARYEPLAQVSLGP